VHGLWEHSGRYGELAERLVESRYAVLAFDQRGHGKTKGQRGHVSSYEVLLDDIAMAIKEAARRNRQIPLFLYGQSLGGNLVLNYALRRKPKLAGLVVTSPLLRLVSPPSAWALALGRTMNRIWPRFSFNAGLDPLALSHDLKATQAYQQDPLVHRRLSARLGTAMLDAGRWALEHAHELTVPLLLMHGSADSITSAQASQEFADRAGPTCTLRIWDGLLHELHWECERDSVIRCVAEWLDHSGDVG